MAHIVRAAATASRRVDGHVYDARVEAARILAAARLAADEVALAAESQASAIREAARAAGREEGLAEARRTVTWAAAERDRLLESAEPEVVRLAVGIAGKVLRREAAQSSVVVTDMAHRALAEARDRTCVALRAHPADMDALRTAEPRLSALIPKANGMAWVADPSVGRGGVVVETETGSIDGRLEAQLELVARLLEGVRP